MKTSQRGLREIASHEAIVTSKYKDSVGVWTIGIGHTLGAGLPDPRKISGGLSLEKIMDIFKRDIAKFEHRVNKAFARTITQSQFDAAVSFDFNTGGIDRATWVKQFNRGDIKAARKSFMKWSKPKEIIARRRSECRLFFDGQYASNGYVSVYNASPNGKVNWSGGKRIKLQLNRTGVEPTGKASPQTKPLTTKNDPSKRNQIAILVGGLMSGLAAGGVAFWDGIETLFNGW
jgi:lysozyme